MKESLDLYEELITEEQEEKDATYNEVWILFILLLVIWLLFMLISLTSHLTLLQLKSKFVAAQNQVQDLLTKLQQMQTKVM